MWNRSPRFEASREQRDRIARTFFAAIEDGHLDALVEMLTDDVVVYGDGGGVGPSLPRPVHGRDRALRLLASLSEVVRRSELHVQSVTVNGQPGAAVRDETGCCSTCSHSTSSTAGSRRCGPSSIPRKLRHLGPLLDPRTLRGARSGELGADVP